MTEVKLFSHASSLCHKAEARKYKYTCFLQPALLNVTACQNVHHQARQDDLDKIRTQIPLSFWKHCEYNKQSRRGVRVGMHRDVDVTHCVHNMFDVIVCDQAAVAQYQCLVVALDQLHVLSVCLKRLSHNFAQLLHSRCSSLRIYVIRDLCFFHLFVCVSIRAIKATSTTFNGHSKKAST